MTWFDWPLITALGLAWAGAVSVIVILQRRPAASTIAWLLVLLLLPVLGLILFRLIGPLRLERKKLRRAAGRKLVRDSLGALASLATESPEDLQLALVPIAVGEAAPMRARAVEVYTDGKSTYAALLAAVAAAQHHIHLEYYIWEPDGIGTRLRDALVERAKAGVKVRMILDGTGSNNLRRRWLRPLREAGVEVAWFNPVTLRSLRRRRADFRTHRKIVVCDGEVGFTGGMNITDAHSAEFGDQYWRDTHVRIEGTAVWALQQVFLEDWYFVAEQLPPTLDGMTPPTASDGDHIVQIIASGPDSTAFAVHRMFFTVITEARERVWLTTPYFVPDDPLLEALTNAALRGIQVRLLVPQRGDSRLVDWAARSYFPELLQAGVSIFEYLPRFVHAKTVLADDDVSIIGTANLDNRSFRLNFEVCAVVYGEETATTLERAFNSDLADSREVRADDLERVPFRRRLGQATARLFSPLL